MLDRSNFPPPNAVVLLGLAVLALLLPGLELRGQSTYQKPPKDITAILDAPPSPQVSVSPTGDYLLLLQPERYPSIVDVSAPMLRLAGLRINPNTNGPHLPPRGASLSLQAIATGQIVPLAVPARAYLGLPIWAPDGKHFAFTNTTPTAIELWVGESATGKVRRIPEVTINAVGERSFPALTRRSGGGGRVLQWMPGSRELLCRTVVANRGPAPVAPHVPKGPVIQESMGKPSPAPTYQDLLQNSHDEDLFEYYATAQLVLVDLATDRGTPLGKPALFSTVAPAPDGNHLLVVRNQRPYSYLLPVSAFPKEAEVWDRTGRVVTKLATLPLEDQVPIGGVPTGPREFHWLPTEPATLVWAEALDGGDPKKKAAHRDELKMLRVAQSAPVAFGKTQQRYQSLLWGEKGGPALLEDFDRDRRRQRTFLIDTAHLETPPRLLWDLSVNDRYNDPGDPMLRTLPTGHRILWQHQGHLFLTGTGATPSGDRPFLDRFDLKSLKAERLFRCAATCYESVLALLAEDGSRLLTHHETPTDPPNYFVRFLPDEKKALTHFIDPTPQLRGIKKQLVTYKRADGVGLSFTLYLPPGYKEGQRLPALLWAYPREYTDSDTAGQITGSLQRFTTLTSISHLFLLTQGYAILDGATMPVIGDPETANNTYVEQIVASARAALDKADELGVLDRQRVAVGGHSYGAFMTANLLAHCDLFQAGLARSGAYNRTLTPFGFQAERRTLWEAPETYLKMSPFLHAHKIQTPILLIHGQADDNSGTFPIQSERLYQAIKGNGGTVRYVSLPHEAHGYVARESVEHTLYEMVTWLDRYVKNRPSQGAGTR